MHNNALGTAPHGCLGRHNINIGGATPALSQNMFFTGTNSTMIPLTSEAVTMGVSSVQNAVRTPPALWQYPSKYPICSYLLIYPSLQPLLKCRMHQQMNGDQSCLHSIVLNTDFVLNANYPREKTSKSRQPGSS